ncbi:hypothetical protein BJ508DRAFT_367156 [Ascobolus immersus RN42]|uniref:Uncharacterized protein n=1 Tax=Ascobolus immersus RN42 TaxID=1160509 RepID=A0A3N4HHY6_ASCIM|nr:hypothetical protein BJ508DRAFT_367156 [Ascobolus immersus RN42]
MKPHDLKVLQMANRPHHLPINLVEDDRNGKESGSEDGFEGSDGSRNGPEDGTQDRPEDTENSEVMVDEAVADVVNNESAYNLSPSARTMEAPLSGNRFDEHGDQVCNANAPKDCSGTKQPDETIPTERDAESLHINQLASTSGMGGLSTSTSAVDLESGLDMVDLQQNAMLGHDACGPDTDISGGTQSTEPDTTTSIENDSNQTQATPHLSLTKESKDGTGAAIQLQIKEYRKAPLVLEIYSDLDSRKAIIDTDNNYHYSEAESHVPMIERGIGRTLLDELDTWSELFPHNHELYPHEKHIKKPEKYGEYPQGSGFSMRQDEVHYARWVFRGYKLLRRILTRLNSSHVVEYGDGTTKVWPKEFGASHFIFECRWRPPSFFDPKQGVPEYCYYGDVYSRIDEYYRYYDPAHWFPAKGPYIKVGERVEREEKVKIEDTRVYKVIAGHYPDAVMEVDEDSDETYEEAIDAADFRSWDEEDRRRLGWTKWRKMLEKEGRIRWNGAITPIRHTPDKPPTRIPFPGASTKRRHLYQLHRIWEIYWGRDVRFTSEMSPVETEAPPSQLLLTLSISGGKPVIAASEPHILQVVNYMIGSRLLTKLSNWASHFAEALAHPTALTTDKENQLRRAHCFLSGYALILCISKKIDGRRLPKVCKNADGDILVWPGSFGFTSVEMDWLWGTRRIRLGGLEPWFLQMRMEKVITSLS